MKDRNKKILNHFQDKKTWEERYKKIIDLGKKLPSFDEEFKIDKWLIPACQSPLWLKVEEKKGLLFFTGDSEALISKGLLALAIEFYTEKSPQEILNTSPRFIKDLELETYIQARRTNGFKALIEQILQYARAFSLILKEKA